MSTNTPQEEPIKDYDVIQFIANNFGDFVARSMRQKLLESDKLPQKAAPEPKRIVPEGPYFVAQCEGCGFKAASSEWLGGGQIADTGDYGDTYCPVCGHKDCEEAEDDLYVDQTEMLLQKIKALTNAAHEKEWDLYELKEKLGSMKAAPGIEKLIEGMRNEAADKVKKFRDANSDDEISELRYYYGQQVALNQVLSWLRKP